MRNRIAKLALVPAGVMLIAACNTSWIQTAEQYIQVLVPAVGDIIGILQIAGVAGVSQTDVNRVAQYGAEATRDLNEISALLQQYNSANAVTTVQKIEAAANDANQNLNLILPALHATDRQTVQKVTAAVSLAVNTITQLEALLPQAAPNATLARVVKPPTPGQLQKQFNTIFSQ